MHTKVLEIYFMVTFLLYIPIEIGALSVSDPLTPSYSCMNDIYVPLDKECMALISSAMVTRPATAGLLVYVTQGEVPSALKADQGSLMDTIYGSGTWMYGLYHPQLDEKGLRQLICRGQIFSEDQADPSLVGSQDANGVTFQQYNTFRKKIYGTWTGILDPTVTAHSINFGNWSCGQAINLAGNELTFPNDSKRPYDTISFTAAHSGLLTIVANQNGDSLAGGFNPIIAVYGPKGFDVHNPCANLRWLSGNSLQPNIFGGFGSAGNQVTALNFATFPLGSLQINVKAGEKYTFLVTSLAAIETSSDFSLYFLLQDASVHETFPFPQEDTSAILQWDSSFVYLDLKATDIQEIYLSHQQNLKEHQYPGSTHYPLDSMWYNKGKKWLGRRIAQDTGFFSLGTTELSSLFLDSLLYNYGFRPLVEENCNNWEVSISDSFISARECGESILQRTFVVKDFEAKTDLDTAFVQLIFRPLNLNDIRLPPYAVYLDCEDLAQKEFSSDNLPGPEVTGFPFFHTLSGFQSLLPRAFSRRDISIGASYEDQAMVVEDFMRFSFRREWSIYDWCQPWATISYQQLIMVGDWAPPVIDTTTIVVDSRSNPDQCDGVLIISKAHVVDICSATTQIVKVYHKNEEELVLAYFEGKEKGKIWRADHQWFDAYWKDGELVLDGLSGGNYQIQWIVKNEWKNADTFQLQKSIVDVITPSCGVEDSLTVTFNNSGVWLSAQQLDRGSWDNCYELDFKISMDTAVQSDAEWTDKLLIGCNQETFSLPVYLKVTEKRPIDAGIALSSICRTFIQLKDSGKPSCRDIEQQVIRCNERFVEGNKDTAEYWNTYFRDSITLSQVLLEPYCGSLELDDNLKTVVELESCGFGNVVRTYALKKGSAENYWADTCTMTLNIMATHRYQIDFPGDQFGQCFAAWPPATLQLSEWGCDLVTSSVHEEQFDARAEECYQIHRTFSVINWCEYAPECSTPWSIERRDWNRDGVMGDPLSILVAYEEVPSGKATQVDSTESVLWVLQGSSAKAIDSLSLKEYRDLSLCDGDTLSSGGPGFFKYKQIISVLDTVPPVLLFDEDSYEFSTFNGDIQSGCSSIVQISGTITDGCTIDKDQLFIQKILIRSLGSTQSPDEIDPQYYFLDDTVFTIELDVPIGQYDLSIQAVDGCGNLRIISTTLKVVDAKGPAPICIDGLAVELMPDLTGEGAIAEVYAADFLLQTPIEDCSGDTRDYRMVHLKPWQLDPLSRVGTNSLKLYCKDIDFSGLPLKVAVIAEDSAGNRDYCTSQLVLQDNLEICGYGIISGQIKTGNGQAVEGVTIHVNDSLEVTQTRSDGNYSIGPISWGRDYNLFPQKSGKQLDGVSTLDLVMVSQHLLGKKLLENPYQLIAADVNGSNSVSTLDIIWMRKMILKQIDQFPLEKSWRFIPGDWQFSDNTRPWAIPFPEITEVQDLKEHQMSQDFIAIKVGDVNFSYLNFVEARDDQPLVITYPEINLKKGNRYEITFYGNREEVTGFQLELAYNGLQIEDLGEGKVKAEHLNRSLGSENKILISWNGSGAIGCLFTLVVLAQEDGLLSDKIKVGGDLINPEGYEEGEGIIPIELRPMDSEAAERLSNEVILRTNPVQRVAYFDFSLAEKQLANLIILDNYGKLVYRGQKILGTGRSTWTVEMESFLSSGLFYYQIEMNQAWYSGKMIRLNH